jgi:hypothetical protein
VCKGLKEVAFSLLEKYKPNYHPHLRICDECNNKLSAEHCNGARWMWFYMALPCKTEDNFEQPQSE